MIWLRRLFNAPVLLGLHCQHSVAYLKVQKAQFVLFDACAEGEQEKIDICTSELELHCERLADLDTRMKKLWHSL